MLDDAQVLSRVLNFDIRAIQVVPVTPSSLVNGKVNLTNTTASNVITPSSGKKIAITSILVTNADTIVSSKVEIRDGTTVKIIGYARKEGGFAINGGMAPIFVGTVDTAITARCVTDSADVDVFIAGYEQE